MNFNNQFPTEYYDDLHQDESVNFQLNRFLAYVGKDELDKFRSIGNKVSNFDEWKKEFLNLARETLEQGDKIRAGYYYRAAEFFMWNDDPKKQATREKFLQLVREGYGITDEQHHLVHYKDENMEGYLPAYFFDHPEPKDTFVIMGGGDSYVEEWFPLFMGLNEQRYRFVVFEAPGQGGALQEYNLPMTHEYHKAASAILDHFELEDVCFWGISGGGMAALRVAAYEKRVQRVICHDILYDVFDAMFRKVNPAKNFLLSTLMSWGLSGLINMMVKAAMKKDLTINFLIKQGMHIHGVDTPYKYLEMVRKEKTGDISHLVDQDVLLLAGTEDFGVPLDHFYKQIEALKNVRSLTARMFTREEQAQNHCQVGNIGLVLDVITNWIDLTLETQEKWDIQNRQKPNKGNSVNNDLVSSVQKN